ncbi:50S ribosomal protein L15 [Candidatus Collierbacteria bacterium RIFOXYD1_FULL_40_9]|uniref:Large ribosomal subunit protein uL15 n=1 Tax=Candidatus Collierbacteria bacterium RIFOXYD1_FULL_40_9 TaxID=1817731 RepID=A0A1F5FWE3_9BACT|nr:ribosomal protein L15 [uncultured bacterium]OGD83940.1 MAG: 50S ribosomal protein L15 [Candidatus Collierbacteria bacterium RIFOXYD1_FULL_40_9]
MLLSNLPKVIKTPKKRLGRGRGSGVGGHTVGRGQKGQKTRGIIPLWFEGGQLPLVRRTPFIKGKHRFQVINDQPTAVNFDLLSKHFDDKAVVDSASLAKVLKVSEKVAKYGFKVIATGKLTKALEVKVAASAGAIKAILASGGSHSA